MFLTRPAPGARDARCGRGGSRIVEHSPPAVKTSPRQPCHTVDHLPSKGRARAPGASTRATGRWRLPHGVRGTRRAAERPYAGASTRHGCGAVAARGPHTHEQAAGADGDEMALAQRIVASVI